LTFKTLIFNTDNRDEIRNANPKSIASMIISHVLTWLMGVNANWTDLIHTAIPTNVEN
jgi:hypothetical protein